MIDTRLAGRVAIVTGGNNPVGIGAAVARALAAQGCAVCVHYLRRHVEAPDADDAMGESYYWRTQSQTADAVVEAIRDAGGRAIAVEGDLRDPELIEALFDKAEASFGPVEVLVNNAAASDPDTFVPSDALDDDARAVDGFGMASLTAASCDTLFQSNTRATALMMAAFARRHVARGAAWGRVVNISTDGADGFATQVSYGASKAAIESYSRAAAKELGRFGITVNVASLGPIQTGWISPGLEGAVARSTPMGRVGVPEDVADVVVFLASEQARWVTGQLVHVGGGHRM